MNGFGELFFYIVCIVVVQLVVLLASFIENTFFSLRITFSNSDQQKDITKFLKKYHIKHNTRYHNQNGTGEIIAEKGLLSVIVQIIKYLGLSRFFIGYNIIENAYFNIIYDANNVTITNKITQRKIVNINNNDEIWDFAIDNISEFFDENQLINKLKEFGYITDKQVNILRTSKILTKNNVAEGKDYNNNYARNRRKILDINNCTIKQLNALPGITLIIAKKLIKYREDNEGFNTVADFWNIAGLSFHQRIEIEKLAVLKAKKAKKIKSAKIFINTIEMLCERIVDI